MKRKFSSGLTLIIVTAALAVLSLAGCGSAKKAIPFTEHSFETTLEELIASEGETDDTYDSVYYGTTYSYPKEYLEKTGKIKYMTDDNDKIQRIAWAYESDNDDDIIAMGDAIYKDLVKVYGEPELQQGVNNASQIWKRPGEGNIIMSVVLTSDAKMIQVAFFSPEVSTNE